MAHVASVVLAVSEAVLLCWYLLRYRLSLPAVTSIVVGSCCEALHRKHRAPTK